MNYGFEGNKFYIEFMPCQRPVGNLRQESELRARNIALMGNERILCLSGGIDSQITLHSFLSQGISIDTVFFHTPGFNDHELENVKVLNALHNLKTEIITVHPTDYREEIEHLAVELDMPGKYHLLQSIYINQLPKHYNIIQNLQDPFVYVFQGYAKYGFVQGYFSPEISRIRAVERLNRTGQFILHGWTTEYMLSMIDNNLFRAGLTSARYFDGNGLSKANTFLTIDDRWDYYIKPLVYADLWGDKLIYFPKSNGYEQLEWLHLTQPGKGREHAVLVPYNELITFLKSGTTEIKRFYENVPHINTK